MRSSNYKSKGNLRSRLNNLLSRRAKRKRSRKTPYHPRMNRLFKEFKIGLRKNR
jgi:hypothetical protein